VDTYDINPTISRLDLKHPPQTLHCLSNRSASVWTGCGQGVRDKREFGNVYPLVWKVDH